MHVLDGPRIKIERANEHLNVLNRYLRMWNDMKPYHAVLYPEPEHDRYVIRMEIGATPPAEWGAVIGDFAFNLRSALDQTAFALVRHFHPGLAEKELKTVQFPVFLNEPTGNELRSWRRQSKYLGPAYDFIESLQPYRRTRHPPEVDRLWLLHEKVCNADKHRIITPLGHRYRMAVMLPPPHLPMAFMGLFNHGDVIGFTPLSAGVPSGFDPNLAGQVVFDVGIRHDGLDIGSLRSIHNYVAEYIFPILSSFIP